MLVESIACNNCGAPLSIPGAANFVTCIYCKASLSVKRNNSVVYTEVLGRIEAITESMADDLRFLRLERELEYLDKHWREDE